MAAIDPPKRHEPYPDRDIDCQQAIEDALHELIDTARAAGWSDDEIVEAIDQLTLAYRMAARKPSTRGGAAGDELVRQSQAERLRPAAVLQLCWSCVP
jgi:hypothetical protein